MVETQPHAENKPADHRRRDKSERKIQTGKSGPEADHAQKTSYALTGVVPKNASFPEEEEEMAQIYQRIDRELAVEEARADRLLQQRASR